MILTREMENGFIAYDVATRTEGEFGQRCLYDDVFVHWEETGFFGVKRKTKRFDFKRFQVYTGGGYSYTKLEAFNTFCERLNELKNKKGGVNKAIIEKLKNDFNGSDDYSMGVQYALSVLESNKLI